MLYYLPPYMAQDEVGFHWGSGERLCYFGRNRDVDVFLFFYLWLKIKLRFMLPQ